MAVSGGDERRRRRRRTPGIHDVGILQRLFLAAIEQRVDHFHALREAVILIRYLVFPGAKSAAAEDVARLEGGLNAGQSAVAIERWNRVPMLESRVPHMM